MNNMENVFKLVKSVQQHFQSGNDVLTKHEFAVMITKIMGD